MASPEPAVWAEWADMVWDVREPPSRATVAGASLTRGQWSSLFECVAPVVSVPWTAVGISSTVRLHDVAIPTRAPQGNLLLIDVAAAVHTHVRCMRVMRRELRELRDQLREALGATGATAATTVAAVDVARVDALLRRQAAGADIVVADVLGPTVRWGGVVRDPAQENILVVRLCT